MYEAITILIIKLDGVNEIKCYMYVTAIFFFLSISKFMTVLVFFFVCDL